MLARKVLLIGMVLSTAKADKLGRRALDRIFGKGQWHFITLDNKMDSVVTKRLRAEEPGLPFFN